MYCRVRRKKVSTAFVTKSSKWGNGRKTEEEETKARIELENDPVTLYSGVLHDKEFGNVLLRLCYAFYETYHNKPKNFLELAEFSKLKEIEALVQQYKTMIDKAHTKKE
jgi:hypothetical protein